MSCGRDGSKPPAGSNQSKGPTKGAGFAGASHHQPARLASVSKLASETHEIPCRTPPCALAGSIILSIAGSVLMSVDTRRHHPPDQYRHDGAGAVAAVAHLF